jgi:hypothetical protein
MRRTGVQRHRRRRLLRCLRDRPVTASIDPVAVHPDIGGHRGREEYAGESSDGAIGWDGTYGLLEVI